MVQVQKSHEVASRQTAGRHGPGSGIALVIRCVGLGCLVSFSEQNQQTLSLFLINEVLHSGQLQDRTLSKQVPVLQNKSKCAKCKAKGSKLCLLS